MQEKLVSVIIPTYNPGEYIEDCLKSIESQTISKDLFETILILNGDCSHIGYLESLVKDNIRLLYTPIKGVSNARNLGIESTKGNYIIFVDDDDFLSKSFLENLINTQNYRHDCISVSNVQTYNDGILGKDYIGFTYDRLVHKKNYYSLISNRSFLSSVCCKIIPRSIIGNVRFNTSLSVHEDASFMFSISNQIKYIYPSSKDCIYFRRIRKNSESRKRRTKRAKFKNSLKAMIAYSKTFFSDIYNYSFILYLSRCFASILNIFR